jgi:hypothetical protein
VPGCDSVREHHFLQQQVVQPLQHAVYEYEPEEQGRRATIGQGYNNYYYHHIYNDLDVYNHIDIYNNNDNVDRRTRLGGGRAEFRMRCERRRGLPAAIAWKSVEC